MGTSYFLLKEVDGETVSTTEITENQLDKVIKIDGLKKTFFKYWLLKTYVHLLIYFFCILVF